MSFLLLVVIGTASQVQWLGPPPPVPATRVISLAPSITETILSLGGKSSLIAVSRFCEFPEVAALPRAGGFNDISIETVVALKPQLLVVAKSPGNQKAVETLARLGISVLALPLTTVDDAATSMTELGRALGRDAAAKTMVNELAEARLAQRAVVVVKPKVVLFVVGFAPLVVAGPGSFAHELLEDCGAKNAAEKAPTAYPTYSMEKAVTLAPDVVIDASDVKDGREAVVKLGAMKKARWVTLPTKALLHPGPALAKALPSLCELVR